MSKRNDIVLKLPLYAVKTAVKEYLIKHKYISVNNHNIEKIHVNRNNKRDGIASIDVHFKAQLTGARNGNN